MDVGDQGGALLLHGGETRCLAEAIALEDLRRGDFEQAALLQGREFPCVGNRKEAFQGSAAGVPRRASTRGLQDQSRAATRLIAWHNGTHYLQAYS
jgi:hypothetical protein